MSTLEILIRIVAGVALTGMNAFFVVTEFALTRLRQFPASEIRQDPRLQRAWEMTEELEIYLTGCQLGITTSSILLGVVAEPAVTHLLRPVFDTVGITGATAATVSVVAAVVVINLVHKIWGEQAPTYLGVERPREVARWAAPALYWWTQLTYPVIKLGDGAAKLTLRAFGVEMERSWVEGTGEREMPAEEGPPAAPAERDSDSKRSEPGAREGMLREVGELLARGDVPPDRREEVLRTLEIGQVPVRKIMVPASDIVVLSRGVPLDENIERIREAGHSRYPLVSDDDLSAYLGTLYTPSLLPALGALRDGEIELQELAAEPLAVDPDLPVADFIDYLQETGQELALVRDDDGEVLGLVTVTDAVEAILGELRDPLDPES